MAELSYLENYEKNVILYNTLYCKEYKLSIQYMWLFQNNSSVVESQNIIQNIEDKVSNNFSESVQSNYLENQSNRLYYTRHIDKIIYLKASITIYLANS
jgi:hypothetical protein